MEQPAPTRDLCPACRLPIPATDIQPHMDWVAVECPRCQPYRLGYGAQLLLTTIAAESEIRPALTFRLRRMSRSSHRPMPMLTREMVDAIIASPSLPTPAEQADHFVVWLGSRINSPGQYATVRFQHDWPAIGARTEAGARFIAMSLVENHLLQHEQFTSKNPDLIRNHLEDAESIGYTLTFDGWKRLEELKRGSYDSRKAFMAMKYGDAWVDDFFRGHLKPAAAAAGFDLVRLDENARARLIDDRLRVEIQTSKFLVADLTHGNNGAYWEAGYAEGLGRPVIYTCREDVFNDKEKSKATHFDTNHHLTVLWRPDDMAGAASRLKDTIRATLPAEAKLED